MVEIPTVFLCINYSVFFLLAWNAECKSRESTTQMSNSKILPTRTSKLCLIFLGNFLEFSEQATLRMFLNGYFWLQLNIWLYTSNFPV